MSKVEWEGDRTSRVNPIPGLVGSGCGLLFFGFFFLFGVAFAAATLWPVWRANRTFLSTTCTILDERIVESRDSDGVTYRPEFLIRYTVDGRAFETWTFRISKVSSSGRAGKQAILDRYEVGKPYPCWYDPEDPGTAVLERGLSFDMLLAPLMGTLFAGIGLVGLVWTLWKARATRSGDQGRPHVSQVLGMLGATWATRRLSPERRSIEITRRATELGLVPDVAASPEAEFPHVPGGSLDDRPSEVLPIRLSEESPQTSPSRLLLITLIWNGITWLLAGLWLSGSLDDNSWLIGLILVPFLLIGLGCILGLVRSLMIHFGVGPTAVEVSTHPLQPGESCDLYIRQEGQLSLNALRVLLVCEEVARYRQGTDTRTETKPVHESEILHQEGVEVLPGLPFGARGRLTIPEGAMHSFLGDNNRISWKVVVRGDVARWPDFERSFPLVVRPPSVEEPAP